MATPALHWRWWRWRDLDPDTLYGFLRLRSAIFVVEQNCVFPDMDGADPACDHLCGLDPARSVRAYLRLVPPGVKDRDPSLGRVVVDAALRGTGLGRELMRKGIAECERRHPRYGIFLSGQQHLETFYASLGFVTESEPYLEDGIWHVNLRRPAILGAANGSS